MSAFCLLCISLQDHILGSFADRCLPLHRVLCLPDTLNDEERVRLELILPGTASIDASEVAGSPYCENGIHPGLYCQAH